MKKKVAILLVTLLVSYSSTHAQWAQIGQDIYGEAEEDLSGFSVSLSSDGSVMAIGAPGNDGNGNENIGHVRVYKNIDGTWTQVGQDINGEAANDGSGASVSLSSDGAVVAIGASGNDGNGNQDTGHVRIYQNIDGTWTQVGQDIDGEAANDFSGRSVSLSSDGSVVAVGAPSNEGNGILAGHARIYQNINGIWVQIGQDIDGEAALDLFGWPVSLSSNGLVVAIGASRNDGNGESSGHVRIYQNINGTWTQIGQDIDGEAAFDFSGRSVSLSSDGSVVAIGAFFNDGNDNEEAGHVRIYQNIDGTWTQVGQDIDGEAASDQSGLSVSLSSDGVVVAIGAVGNDGNGESSGHVRIYQNINGTWTQIGQDIDGEANDLSGSPISLNSNGSIVAIGATNNNGNGTRAGVVRVYGDVTLGISEYSNLGISIYPNPTKGIINLKFINNNSPQVSIYDITGRIIYNKPFLMNNNPLQIDLAHFKNGIYIIKIQEANKVLTSKIVKE